MGELWGRGREGGRGRTEGLEELVVVAFVEVFREVREDGDLGQHLIYFRTRDDLR